MQSGLEETVLTGDSRGHYRQKPEKGLGVCAKGFITLEGGDGEGGFVPDIPSLVCVCFWRLMVCRQTGTGKARSNNNT